MQNFKVPKVEVKLPTSKYKAGDKVKIVNNTCFHGIKIGEVVTLDRVFAQSNNTAWFTKEYKTRWYIRESDFEPYVPPKYYNGKAVCVETDGDFTKGKIYEFVDGQTRSDRGTARPCGYRVEKSFDEWEQRSGGRYKFLPIVE